MVKFSVLPSVSRERQNYAPTFLHRMLKSDAFVLYLPLSMFFSSITLVDSFSMISILPGIIGASSLMIASYY